MSIRDTHRQVSTSLAHAANKELVDCIDHIEQSKKHGRPLTLVLRPNFELLSQLKQLHVLFLDENGMQRLPDQIHGRADKSLQIKRDSLASYVMG